MQYKNALGRRNLVTPQFIVANKPTRQIGKVIQAEAAKAPKLAITVTARAKGGVIEANVKLAKLDAQWSLPANAVVRTVLYQKQAVTNCKTGENKGRSLKEYFAVIDAPKAIVAAGVLAKEAVVQLKPPTGEKSGNLGVVVLVEDPKKMVTFECIAVDVQPE